MLLLTMTSREIAELTGKDHGNVMRDIRAMIDAISTDSNLNPCAKSTTYAGKDGRQYPQYELDKDTCLTLLLGYDAVARMKVVKRWQELERMVDQPKVPQSMPEALRLAAEAIEQRDRLALENKAQAEALAQAQPKAEALDRIATADGSLCLTDAAKTLQVQPRKFMQLLQEKGWVYRRPMGAGWLAYQDRIQAGQLGHKATKGEKSCGTTATADWRRELRRGGPTGRQSHTSVADVRLLTCLRSSRSRDPFCLSTGRLQRALSFDGGLRGERHQRAGLVKLHERGKLWSALRN